MSIDFQNISSILDRILEQHGILTEVKKEILFKHWTDALGEVLSKSCRPVKLERGILFLRAKNSIWNQELSIKKKEIIKKVNNYLKRDLVKDIVFI